MPIVKKFLLVWFVENRYSSMSRRFRNFLTHMAAVASLFVLCAQLLLLFLASLAWLAFHVLIGHGLSPERSVLILSAGLLAVLGCGVYGIRRAFGDMHSALDSELYKKPSLSQAAVRLADSFAEGLLADIPHARKR